MSLLKILVFVAGERSQYIHIEQVTLNQTLPPEYFFTISEVIT